MPIFSRRSAWWSNEVWHPEHRFLDFNGDGALDIVPQNYAYDNGNVLDAMASRGNTAGI